MFRKVLYILWVIFLATPALLGGPIERELEEYHKEGVRQLKELIRSNEWNDAQGLSHQNNYIFSFERKDKWLEEKKEDVATDFLLTKNQYDEINKILQAYNAKPEVTNLYVCLVNEWPVTLIKKMDESINSTSEWIPYTGETAKKKILERFSGLVGGIVNEALKDYPNSSTFAVAKFIGNYLDTDGKVKYQHGYLRHFYLKSSVPNRENIKPSLVPLTKNTFFDRLKKNVESIINEFNEKQELVNDAILTQMENKPAMELVLPPQLVKESFQIVEHLKGVSGEEAALLLKSEVEDFAKVLKDGLSQYPHEKARKYKDDEYYHILNIDKLFSFQFFGENKKGYRVLEDRLRYLYEEENVEVYAVYKEVDFVFDDPNTFAANVLNSIKDKIGNRKVVLVTIPYCYPKKYITGVRAQYVMPGLAATHNNILDMGVIDGHPFENTFQLLYSVYSNLEKPCRIYYAILQADGTPIFSVEDLGRKRNYPFINGVYYLVNPGIQTVRSLPAPYLKTYLDGNLYSDHDNSPDPVLWNERNKYNGQPQLEVSEAWSQYYLDKYQYNITRQSLIDEYNVNKPNRSWEKASNNIKEKYIPDYYMAYGIHMVFQESGMIKFLHSVNELMISEGEFSQLGLGVLFQFQAYKNLHTVLGGSPLSYADIAYDFEVSSVLNSIVFLTIDIVGLIPGVDQIADAVGVGYSWLVGDQNNANAYLIGLAVMGGGTLVIKGVQKYGKHIYKGTIYVLDATGKVVRKISASSEKRIAQLANLFNVSDDFIPASQLSQLEGMINNGQVDRRILREILNEPTEAGRITKIKDTFAGKNVLSKVDDGIGTATSGVGMFKRATRLSDETIEVLAKRVDDLKLSPNQIDALVDDLINGSDDFVRAITRNKGELVDSWKVLHELNPKSFIKTDVARLEVFHKLNSENQQLIRQFTDVDANSTLAKFLDDCDADTDFLAFINNSDNATQVKGFLAHKEGMLTADENRLLAEMLDNSDEIPNTKVRKWLEYGDNMAIFRANREAGNTFGNLMKTQLKDASSEAYQALKRQIPNLDDYSIYSQVQLCLKRDCISKGNYWIPDFVLVAERNGPAGKYLETIIVDSKLSRGTGWTPNQIAADKLSSWTVKSGGASNLVKGELIDLSTLPELNRNGSFIKLFEENGVLKTLLKE